MHAVVEDKVCETSLWQRFTCETANVCVFERKCVHMSHNWHSKQRLHGYSIDGHTTYMVTPMQLASS